MLIFANNTDPFTSTCPMELLAEKPLRLTIHSSDAALINTNLIVSAHPQSSILRLLQYVHYQLTLRRTTEDFPLLDVSSYCLMFQGRVLPLEGKISGIHSFDPQTYTSVSFERVADPTGSALNMDYDPVADFERTAVKYEVNTLSKFRLLQHVEQGVPLSCNLSKLEKYALEHLVYEEGFMQEENLCALRGEHTLQSFLGMKLRGQEGLIELNEATRDYYMDSSLQEVLGIDFAPCKGSVFTLMIFAKHVQDVSRFTAHPVTIELISNLKLFQNRVVMDESTPVAAVRQFVCDVYSNPADPITAAEVKLVYRGQLVHDKNFAGHDATLLSCIDVNHGAQLHVQIAQTQGGAPHEPFWEHSDFVYDAPLCGERQENKDIEATAKESSDNELRYVTDDGVAVSVDSTYGDAHYARILFADGAPARYVAREHLGGYSAEIVLGGSQECIALSPLGDDYVVDRASGVVRLSPGIVAEMERRTGQLIAFHQLNGESQSSGQSPEGIPLNEEDVDAALERELAELREFQLAHPGPAPFRELSLPRKAWAVVRYAARLCKVCVLTVVYLAWNCLPPFIIWFEVTMFLPPVLVYGAMALFAVVALCRSERISHMWADFLCVNRVSAEELARLCDFVAARPDRVARPVLAERCAGNDAQLGLFEAAALAPLRGALCRAYHVNEQGHMSEAAALRELFRQVGTGAVEARDAARLLCALLRAGQAGAFAAEEARENEFWRLVAAVRREVELSDLAAVEPVRRSVLIARERARALPGAVAAVLVPDPRADDWVLQAAKNCVLFGVLLVPFAERLVDGVIQQRVTERERAARVQVQQQQQLQDEEQLQEEEGEQLPEPETWVSDEVMEQVMPERADMDSLHGASESEGDTAGEDAIDALLDGDATATGAARHPERV